MQCHRTALFAFLVVLVFPYLCPCIDDGFVNIAGAKGNPASVTGSMLARVPGATVPAGAPTPITNYTIVALLNTDTHSVAAQTTIKYVNHADVHLHELVFHLYPNAFATDDGGIDMNSVRYGGNDLDWVIGGADQTVLTVSLGGAGPGQLEPGANITLVLNYDVRVPNVPDRFGWYQSPAPQALLAYNMGNWHPIVAVYDERGWHTAPYTFIGESFYSDVATYEVHLTVPKTYQVAATGELQGITAGADTQTWHWLTGPVRDFTWCASPDYATSSILVGSVNVTSYHALGHASGGAQTLQVAAHCLPIYGNLFGPYAWTSLRIVETDFWAGGMEYPQLVMIYKGYYGSPFSLSPLEVVTAHEIGHEWVPFSIGTDSYAEPWIDEGFASFTEYCFVEYVYGAAARATYRGRDLDSYWGSVIPEGDDCINQSVAYWELHYSEYGLIVYTKAALVYDMLRNELGNDTFYDAWHYIYQQTLHQNLRARDLQRLFEESAGQSLDWFFNRWVFGSGIVTVSIGSATAYQEATGWVVAFQITQAQSSPVALRVPIYAVTSAGTEVTWVWMNAAALTSCQISLSALPTTLLIDRDRLLLCRYAAPSTLVGLSPSSPLFQQIVIVAAIATAIIVALSCLWYRRRRARRALSHIP